MSPETVNATRTLACSKTYLKGRNEILKQQFHGNGMRFNSNIKKESSLEGIFGIAINVHGINFKTTNLTYDDSFKKMDLFLYIFFKLQLTNKQRTKSSKHVYPPLKSAYISKRRLSTNTTCMHTVSVAARERKHTLHRH